jgi:hypothetical protein
MSNRKPTMRYQIKTVRDKILAGRHSNDLAALISEANQRPPAYVVDQWAKPTPEVVHVAPAPEAQVTQ